jgi:mannonate dehydratase
MPRNLRTGDLIDRRRRRFLEQSAIEAAALGALVMVPGRAPAVEEPARRPRGRSKIRIGTRISPAWLKSDKDNDLRFLKQIGVDYVDVTLDQVKGYAETGSFSAEALKEFIRRLGDVGLRIERANSLGPYYLNAHLARVEGEREITNLKKVAELLAAADVPVFGIQACQATQHLKEGARSGWTSHKGRGGYEYPAFDQAQSEKAPKPAYQVSADQLWKGLLNIYKQVIPVIEGSKTRLAMHGNDPPIATYLGNPQILCRFADFDRLFRSVPSKHSGITFCVGTRYESGEDVFQGIRHFGKEGKLFHVHFRNVRGTLPTRRAYEEVSVDDGDLDMAKVVRTLEEVGYEGVIDYDHPIGITGDGPLPKQYIAFAVGYMRGLLDGLPD